MSWDAVLQEWLIDEPYPYCYGAALANISDCAIYAAAPAAGDAGWGHVFKADHEVQQMQDDGSEITVTINEATTLWNAVTCDLRATGPPKGGIWIGGYNYKVVQQDKEFESGEHKFNWVLASRNKGGAHIVCTDKTVIVALFDEDLGQTGGNAKKGALALAEYLVGQGL